MHKITKDAWAAFMQGSEFRRSNTQVFIDKGRREMYLYDTAIAIYERGKLTLNTGGYNTVTTRERLNGAPGVNVYVRRGTLYLNGTPWNGKRRAIKIKL